MYIIDKHNDFYDHYSNIYGRDKAISFDRRGSNRITDTMLVNLAVHPYHYHRETEGAVLLEVGDVQYLIHVYDIVYRETLGYAVADSYKVKLLHTYEQHRHIFNPIIGICRTKVYTRHFWRKDSDIIVPSLEELIRRCEVDTLIALPILAETKLTAILNSETIWRILQNYISSLNNDRNTSTAMTDTERASTHGFDKYSFRHPVK